VATAISRRCLQVAENAKQVIGVGVKQSTSDLPDCNCDEFIFTTTWYVKSRRAAAKREASLWQALTG